MKIIIYTLLLLTFSGYLAAQPYKSIFGKDSTSWVFEYYNLPGKSGEEAKIKRDTSINDTIYKIVELISLRGYLREDTLSGKVWYRGEDLVGPPFHEEPWPQEILAFDYNLQPGDSFDVNSFAIPNVDTPPLYSKVDSVAYINGAKYIYFDRSDPGWVNSGITESYVMIEGSGGNMSPLWKSQSLSFNVYFTQYLLCYYKDGAQTPYVNHRYKGDCFNQVGMNDLLYPGLNPLTVYPNPSSGKVMVVLPSAGKATISLTDITGRCLLQRTIKDHQGNYSLDLVDIPDGIYMLKVQSMNGKRGYAKLSVKK